MKTVSVLNYLSRIFILQFCLPLWLQDVNFSVYSVFPAFTQK